jgi:hypothetical protein
MGKGRLADEEYKVKVELYEMSTWGLRELSREAKEA